MGIKEEVEKRDKRRGFIIINQDFSFLQSNVNWFPVFFTCVSVNVVYTVDP